MSYILDALRKSDQERQRDKAPLLRSIHSEFGLQRQSRIHWAVVALAAAILGGAAGAGVWFVLDGRLEAVPEQTQATAEALDPAASDATSASADGQTPQLVATTPASNDGEATLVESPGRQTRNDDALLELWQLTEAEQKFLAGLQVSLHVYSPEPAQRTAIINGFRVREGQTLGQDLSLLEIVADGLILQFQDQRVHLSTVAGW